MMINHSYEFEWFGDLMFQYVMNVLAHEREGHIADWWMDKERRYFWFKRAFNIRKSINERSAQNVR